MLYCPQINVCNHSRMQVSCIAVQHSNEVDLALIRCTAINLMCAIYSRMQVSCLLIRPSNTIDLGLICGIVLNLICAITVECK